MHAFGRTLALSFALTNPTYADFTGKVVAVADGDTITVLRDYQQIKVRLTEIDAPEKAQAFGNKSKQSLSELCFGKTATLDDKGKDRYGRTLARVTCDGIDANTEQVRRGMAWVYRKYTPKNSPLYRLEAQAMTERRGLWSDPAPMAPWEWRHRPAGAGGTRTKSGYPSVYQGGLPGAVGIQNKRIGAICC